MDQIIIYILALFIGFILGMLGGGGSVLTVPVLVYIGGISAVLATSYSLFSIGLVSLVGALRFYRSKLIDWKAIIFFGTSSLVTVFLARRYLLDKIPSIVFQSNNLTLTKGGLMMIIFSIIMVAVSIIMLKGIKVNRKLPARKEAAYLIIEGAAIGLLTGIVGVGGGFLIVPSLVFFRGRSMHSAVGTSLLIIFINAMVGFFGDIKNGVEMDWFFLLPFTALAAVGILVGTWCSKKVSHKNLRKIFAYFILILGAFILAKELF